MPQTEFYKKIICRIGVSHLIEWSEQKQVPVLVFSAGLGECVVAALTAAKLLPPHVKVNKMLFISA